jgi:hypothetical protein
MGMGDDHAGPPGSAVGSSYPSTPPKVVGGRKGRRGGGEARRFPGLPVGPDIGVLAVGSIARSRTQERCLCRLPGRTVRCHSRLGGPPSSEGRGDRGGKRCRLRSAEAAQPAGPGPPGGGSAGFRADRIGRGIPVTDGRPGRLGGPDPAGRRTPRAWQARPAAPGRRSPGGLRHTGRTGRGIRGRHDA